MQHQRSMDNTPPPGTRSQHLPPGPGHNTYLPLPQTRSQQLPNGTRSQHLPPPRPGHNTSLPPGPGHNTSLPPRPGHNTSPPPGSQVTTPPSPRTRSQHLPPFPPRTRSQHLNPPSPRPGHNNPLPLPGTRSQHLPPFPLDQVTTPPPLGPGHNTSPRDQVTTPPSPSPRPGHNTSLPPPGPGHNTSLLPRLGHNTSLPLSGTRSQHLLPSLPPQPCAGGRYASYWNAFLFLKFLPPKMFGKKPNAATSSAIYQAASIMASQLKDGTEKCRST